MGVSSKVTQSENGVESLANWIWTSIMRINWCDLK